MKILLICASGMSTSLLVNNMKKVADKEDVIEAFPVATLEDIVYEYDIVLVGPQLRYKYDKIHMVCQNYNKPCDIIDMISYGQMNGAVVYNKAKEMCGGI